MSQNYLAAKSKRKGCGLVVLIVIGLLCVVALVCAMMWTSEPTYWQANQQYIAATSALQLQQTAEQLEKQFSSRISNLPPGQNGDEQTITISLAQINAWLARRLEGWLVNQGSSLPPQISNIMLATQGDELVLAFELSSDEIEQVVSVVLEIKPQPGDKVGFHLIAIRAGRLPVPVGFLAEQLQTDTAGNNTLPDLLTRASAGLSAELVQPIDSLRQVRLLDIQPHADSIDLIVREERRR